MKTAEVKPCFVGIDVSKETLDICILPEKKKFTVPNSDFKELCKQLRPFKPSLIVLEPTGGYETPVLKALIKAGFKVSRESAQKIHYYAKSRGKLAKTDGIDAENIASYAQKYVDEIKTTSLPDKESEVLRQLIARRKNLVNERAREKTRIKKPDICKEVLQSCEKRIQQLNKEISKLEKQIQVRMKSHSEFQKKMEILQSFKGIGETTASNLLIYLPELGQIKSKPLAALSGVAPYQRESGQYKGEQHIRGGRKEVRTSLYMAALSAIQFNPVIKEFYERLINKGKDRMVAIVACMHKMLRILNAMIAKGEEFKPI